MSATSAPYGLKPVNLIGGLPYAGATRRFKIESGYASNLYTGQVVAVNSDGFLVLVTNVGSNGDAFPAGVVGVFVGCEYTNPTTSQLTFSQYWPTGTVAADAYAYVVDDPNCVFMGQCEASLAQTALGQNTCFAAAQSTSTGSTTTGLSNSKLEGTTVTTNTVAFRIIGFVESPTSAVGDAFTDVLVKFNAGIHSYNNATGI